jgi:hypothetical protein
MGRARQVRYVEQAAAAARGDAMKTERIEVHIEVLNDGRLRAISPDELIVADGEHIADLRRNVDDAVQAHFGERRPVALMIGRRVRPRRSS